MGIGHWEGRGGSGHTSSCRVSRLMGRYMRAAAAAASPSAAELSAEDEENDDAASPCCRALPACPASTSAAADAVADVDANPPPSTRLSARGAA